MRHESITDGLPVIPNLLTGEPAARYCPKCLAYRPSPGFGSRATCGVCKDRSDRYQAKTAPARRVKDVARIYGLTTDQLESMREDQANLCAICGEPETKARADGHVFALAVDHNHVTGEVRALLCYRCNQLVGWLEQASPSIIASAVAYLNRYA